MQAESYKAATEDAEGSGIGIYAEKFDVTDAKTDLMDWKDYTKSVAIHAKISRLSVTCVDFLSVIISLHSC